MSQSALKLVPIPATSALPDMAPDGAPEGAPSFPHPASEEFYSELTRRNVHFISAQTQQRLRKLKVLVAGCGSTGGACTESLARVGVTRFALADSGSYELNNLNRQHAFLSDLGKNKAEFHAQNIRRIHPTAEIICDPRGITRENVNDLCAWADVIVDAVDVTTSSAIEMKLALHVAAHKHRRPVFSALDLGYCQWGRSYDYRKDNVQVLDGKLEQALAQVQNPLKSLLTLVPLSAFPNHSLPLIHELLTDPHRPASQLGCTSDLLSAIIVPACVRLVDSGELVPGWNINLEPLARPWPERLQAWRQGWSLRRKIRKLLRNPS